jgi:hypothetical protein
MSSCTIKTDVADFVGKEVLKCNAPMTGNSFTPFRVTLGSGLMYLYGTLDLVSSTAASYLIELGVFRGGDCF